MAKVSVDRTDMIQHLSNRANNHTPWMEVEFTDENLDRLETDADFTAGYSAAIVKAFRRRMQAIRAALDERDLYAVRGNNFEKLKGKRDHQYSVRLNDQMRLILEIRETKPKHTIVVVTIEDYH